MAALVVIAVFTVLLCFLLAFSFWREVGRY